MTPVLNASGQVDSVTGSRVGVRRRGRPGARGGRTQGRVVERDRDHGKYRVAAEIEVILRARKAFWWEMEVEPVRCYERGRICFHPGNTA